LIDLNTAAIKIAAVSVSDYSFFCKNRKTENRHAMSVFG